MRSYLPVLFALGLATPAGAEVCTFTSECFEGEACLETSFAMEVTADSLITDSETIAIVPALEGVSGLTVGATPSAIHLLTRASDGTARYSTHIFDGPLMINYLGACGG